MIEAQDRQKQAEMEFKAEQAELDRQNDIIIAEIKGAGYGSASDINQNQKSDYQDALEGIRNEQRYQDQMNLKRESEVSKKQFNSEKLNLDREKLLTQKQIADKQLEIARENKNKYDVGAKKKK